MHYNFDNVSAFLQVVKTDSISATALHLKVAKSIVSKRIDDLEADLGVELLYRSARGVVPTAKGFAFHKRAREIMQQLGTAADEITDRQDDLCEQLRVAARMSFWDDVPWAAAVSVLEQTFAAGGRNQSRWPIRRYIRKR